MGSVRLSSGGTVTSLPITASPVPVVCPLSGHRWTEPAVSLGTGEARWRNGAGLGGGTPRWAEASPGEAPDIWDSGCRCC